KARRRVGPQRAVVHAEPITIASPGVGHVEGEIALVITIEIPFATPLNHETKRPLLGRPHGERAPIRCRPRAESPGRTAPGADGGRGHAVTAHAITRHWHAAALLPA